MVFMERYKKNQVRKGEKLPLQLAEAAGLLLPGGEAHHLDREVLEHARGAWGGENMRRPLSKY